MKIGPLKIDFRQLGIIVAIGLVLALVMNFNTRIGEFGRLQNEKATVVIQATGVMSTQEALQTQLAYATSADAVKDYARGEAHMGKPNEKVVIVLPEPGTTPEPSSIPAPVVNNRTPLEMWSLLIFGK